MKKLLFILSVILLTSCTKQEEVFDCMECKVHSYDIITLEYIEDVDSYTVCNVTEKLIKHLEEPIVVETRGLIYKAECQLQNQ